MGERGNAKEAASVSIQINSKDVVKCQKQACIINSGGGRREMLYFKVKARAADYFNDYSIHLTGKDPGFNPQYPLTPNK